MEVNNCLPYCLDDVLEDANTVEFHKLTGQDTIMLVKDETSNPVTEAVTQATTMTEKSSLPTDQRQPGLFHNEDFMGGDFGHHAPGNDMMFGDPHHENMSNPSANPDLPGSVCFSL